MSPKGVGGQGGVHHGQGGEHHGQDAVNKLISGYRRRYILNFKTIMKNNYERYECEACGEED